MVGSGEAALDRALVAHRGTESRPIAGLSVVARCLDVSGWRRVVRRWMGDRVEGGRLEEFELAADEVCVS